MSDIGGPPLGATSPLIHGARRWCRHFGAPSSLPIPLDDEFDDAFDEFADDDSDPPFVRWSSIFWRSEKLLSA